jgi:hypothetical protein
MPSMSEFSFDFEWLDPLGARGPELRATWARLAVSVAGRYPTRVIDEGARTVRDSIYIPLYPIAEWLAANWWLVLFEMESSERAKDLSYESRHNLRSAREGYSLPALSFHSVGDFMQLRWDAETLVHHGVQFLESGSAYLKLDDVQRSLWAFITSVVARLDQSDVRDTFLQQEWAALNSIDQEEADFCVAAATLGIDPFDVDDSVASALLDVARTIPASVRREFLAVASQGDLRRDTSDVAAGIETARRNRAEVGALTQLRDAMVTLPANGGPPWQQGYAAARHLRNDLRIGNEPLPSFSDVAGALRINPSSLSEAIVDQPTSTRVYEAIVATNEKAGPAFAVSRRSERAVRFQFCRGLYEFLAGGDGPWLVTRGLSDRQKRNRAFAAEFLAPAAGIREKISRSSISAEEVDDLAQHYGVASEAIVHQIANHHIATVNL